MIKNDLHRSNKSQLYGQNRILALLHLLKKPLHILDDAMRTLYIDTSLSQILIQQHLKSSAMRLLLLFSLLLFSCNFSSENSKKEPVKVLSATTAAYISNYTEQHIDVDEQLTFRFSGTVIESGMIGQQVASGIFKISPNVNGKAHWKDGSTLVFTPEEIMEYDKTYRVAIQLKALYPEVPNHLNTAYIDYLTNPLNLKVSMGDINYASQHNDKLISLGGSIRTNNVIADDKIEQLLEASQKGNKDLVIQWSHHSSKNRSFLIENIKRSKTPSEVNIKWNAGKTSSKDKGELKFEVLPIGKFNIIDGVVDQSDNKTIIISFSDRVNTSQDLTGLITIDGYKGQLKIDRSGSKLRVYGDKGIPSPFKINVSKDIKRADGDKLEEARSFNLSYEALKPEITLLGKGVIVPDGDEIIFPFLATNLNAVTLEIFKIYEDNVLQFLQYGQLTKSGNLNAVGRVIHQEKINLYDYDGNEQAEERRIALNLKDFIAPEPGALYQVRLGFDQSDLATYECPNDDAEIFLLDISEEQSILSYRNNRDYAHRDNPCHPAYYTPSRYKSRNILASDLGIITKLDSKNRTYVTVTDLKTIEPIGGVSLDYYDYQQQKIGSGSTSGDGQAITQLDRRPSFIILKHAGQYGYANMQDRYANSLSEFDVSGKVKKKGIDGFIYGERGVWRPGDTLFLNFILEDQAQSLPLDHPIKMEVTDARSKRKFLQNTSEHLGHIYHFAIPTSSADPTGNWRATVTVGNQTFTKTLKVETVKPNRLKIEVATKDDKLKLYDDGQLDLKSQWLHGASADGLKAKVDLQLTSTSTHFDGYKEYVFDDPARKVSSTPFTIYDGILNSSGESRVNIKKKKNWLPPGKLTAHLKTRVYEKSGNFSEDNFKVPADLYQSYVGIKIPQTRWGRYFISDDGNDKIAIQSVNVDGKPLANKNMKIGIYKARWSWWYDRGYSNKYNYNSAQHNGALVKDDIKTDANGQASYSVDLDEDYGNYMIRICDTESGHCTGGMFYTGRNWYTQGEKQGPQLLNFSADKSEYNSGENIKLKIPSNKDSKIFISIENAEKVLDSYWVDATGSLTEIDIPTNQEMNPNIYIHASLIQKHTLKENDLPLRMYGVIPVKVINTRTTLNPEIVVPEQARPDTYFDIKISESNGQPMYYTVAVVDEGLLGLTRFNVPDTWGHFFAKQALGVKTWDIYDMVLGGYGAAMDKLISIGGDGANRNANKQAKANRFKPVVKHLGPFKLEAGATATHKIKIENYVGAVRTMVVCREKEKYGSTEKSTQIKKPLMVQATLPRVLGPMESLDIPANVFAMEDFIKDVNVSLDINGLMTLQGTSSNRLHFDKQGDKLSAFSVQVGDQVGVSKVKVNASSGKENGQDEIEIEIEIRNPNPVTTNVQEKALKVGEEWSVDYELFGTTGTNEGVIEVSNIIPVNLDKRLKYLIRYPYGCIEQTVSSIFPQLYLSDLTELSPTKIKRIEKNIQRGIERLSLFQLHNGAMSYWPGSNSESRWGSVYAHHFLLEAKEKGYFIPKSMLDNLTRFLSNTSDKYRYANNDYYYHRGIAQAYRLYTLAKAGSPSLGSMNRLRNTEKLNAPSSHLLAAAYALINKKDVAKKIISNIDITIKPYRETGYSYGSHIRDQAIILEAMITMGETDHAATLANIISKEFNTSKWFSTQSTSFGLLSLGRFMVNNPKEKINVNWSHGHQQNQVLGSDKPIAMADLEVESSNTKKLTVRNNGKGLVYAKLSISGQEAPGQNNNESAKHLNMSVNFKNLKGEKVDPTRLQQGADFLVTVTIKNLGTKGRKIEELALSQIFPSGWEIQNLRLSDMENIGTESSYEYRDVRDDRVNTFFDIGRDKLTYTTLLTASYAGRFFMPPTYVEAMYDNDIQAKSKGQWVEVVK